LIAFNKYAFGYKIAKAAGVQYNPACDVVISREKNGELLGGVIFTGYTGASVHIHVGAFDPKWINPDMLWVTFHYPFIQLGCKVLFGQIPETNSKALEFDLKLGFKIVTRVDDVFPDGGLILVAMRREECRWLKLKPRRLKEPSYGQQE
jgi:hypothetical protein